MSSPPRRALAVLIALAAVSLPPVAHADTPPTVWDIAKDPAERDRWELHERVPAFRCNSGDAMDPERRRQTELRCLDLLDKLEAVDAAHSPDVRLRVDLGVTEYELAEVTGRTELYGKAADVLKAAVDAAPDSPSTTVALDRLVYAYAKLDRPRDELAAWRRYIPLLVDPELRAVDTMNMGEAQMRMGQIDDALGTFREVLRQCGELPNANLTYVLTLWDLAVALDRSGDPRSAVSTAARAVQETVFRPDGRSWTWIELMVERNDTVFFVPAWERQWYVALGWASIAQQATDTRDATNAAKAWALAEHAWDVYVTKSEASGQPDRWVALARLRRDRARREKTAAEKHAPGHTTGFPNVETTL
jgi:tetratricopeptide (TPR) repeat protein